ncbi:MAG: 6-carboxytetrahydropterin synthase QueD [Thermodesulfobacteriota bacterium]
MYEVEITTSFSAAHRLRNYNGKCERLHGHNYKVSVCARSSAPGEGGMVIDFGVLKAAANAAVERLDHNYLNEIEPFDRVEPSAENIAAYLFEEVSKQLNEQADMLYSISIWESDSSRATFIRDVP